MTKAKQSAWARYYATKRMKVGLVGSYERGHKHAAEEIAEKKRNERVRVRRQEDSALHKELRDI